MCLEFSKWWLLFLNINSAHTCLFYSLTCMCIIVGQWLFCPIRDSYMHVLPRVAGNFRGAKYSWFSWLNTGPQIFYPRMKRPCLPLPAVQAATTNIKTTKWLILLNHEYFDPRKLPAIRYQAPPLTSVFVGIYIPAVYLVVQLDSLYNYFHPPVADCFPGARSVSGCG